MGDHVHTGLEQLLGVVEIEKMCCHAKPARVRLLDDGTVDLGRHLLARAEVVIHANLDDVRFGGGDARDRLAGGLGRGGVDDRACDEEPRSPEVGGIALGVACAKRRRLFAAETEDGGDAVRAKSASCRIVFSSV